MPSSKCEFWMDIEHFLGHVISAEGIHVDLKKIKAVMNWEQPKNVLEIRSFLGLVGYYQKFILGFLSIVVPFDTVDSQRYKV